MEAYVRSVGRKNGKGMAGLLSRLRKERPRDDYAMDLQEQGEDIWAVLR